MGFFADEKILLLIIWKNQKKLIMCIHAIVVYFIALLEHLGLIL